MNDHENLNDASEISLALEKEQARFLTLLESDNNAIAIVDKNQNIQTINDKVHEVFGYHKDELSGLDIKMLIEEDEHYDFRQELISFFKKISIDFETVKFNSIGKRKTGESFPIKLQLNVLDTKNGYAETALIRFITEKEDSVDLLEKYTQLLRAKNKELEEFAYVASHDLKEPIRTIRSFTEFLQQNYEAKLDSKGKQSIKFITDASLRMSELVHDLLDYSRIGRNSERSEVNLNDILKSVLADLDTIITETGAKIHINKLPVCKVYPTEIRLLFQNLIFNAIKFRKKGVTPEISINSEKKKNEILFSITDNGIGVEEKFFDRIFMVFQRLHTRDDYEGSGIGLAHCKKIIEYHGGKIWIKSNLGEGSTFYFTIPS